MLSKENETMKQMAEVGGGRRLLGRGWEREIRGKRVVNMAMRG